MKTLKLVMVGIAVILCFVAVPLTAKGAQEEAAVEKEYVLKFNHVLNQNDPFHKAFVKRTSSSRFAWVPMSDRTRIPHAWGTTFPASR